MLTFLLIRIQLLIWITRHRRSRSLLLRVLSPRLTPPPQKAPYQHQMPLINNHLLNPIIQLTLLNNRLHTVRSNRLHSLHHSLLGRSGVIEDVHLTVETYLPVVQMFLPPALVKEDLQIAEILCHQSGFSKFVDGGVDDAPSFLYKYVLEKGNKGLTVQSGHLSQLKHAQFIV